MTLPSIARTLASNATEKLTLMVMTDANWTTEKTKITGSALATTVGASYQLLGTAQGDTVENALTPNELFIDDLGQNVYDWSLSVKGKIRSPFTIADVKAFIDSQPFTVLVVDTEDLTGLTGYADTDTDLDSYTGSFTIIKAFENCKIMPTWSEKGLESENQDLEFVNRLPYTILDTTGGVYEDIEVTLS